ncbi:hypothetical protein BDP27DRAFT_1426417 [Rhodocollybia butyracea]|uniref:Uncharacterized protein n=1 Tax=Rhodocollybia butyracea TaxID=206335 RepID=A0A9P5U1R9_9AGAR|nr:hypothetical protein BDP27DRAFT_1426417 [Rhodocollybia butyracea]
MGTSLSTVNVPNWQAACASKFNCTSDGLVNILGEPIFPTCFANGSLSADVWAYQLELASKTAVVVYSDNIDFTSSAITITTWLLPWLSLIAQLPFEANGSMDLISACLSIGSPALAAYSIALTAFNQRYIVNAFQHIKEMAQSNSRCYYMIKRIDAAAFILQETQQCPMRADQRGGKLASLIILDEDNGQEKFWITAEKDLRNTRRGFTRSFLAQVLLAFLAYLISFMAAVQESLGNPDVGLQFASSTVWSWMFPIVFVQVLSHTALFCKIGNIKKALTDHKFISESCIAGNAGYVAQTALRPSADLVVCTDMGSRDISPNTSIPLLPLHCHHASTDHLQEPSLSTTQVDITVDPASQWPSPTISMGSMQNVDPYSRSSTIPSKQPGTLPAAPELVPSPFSPPRWWGFEVQGDEKTEGPVYNYARILTWFTFSGHVQVGFENAITSLKSTMVQPVTTCDSTPQCRLEPDLKAFLPLSALHQHPHVIHSMLKAAFVALLLQWGTTGAAIFVAYRSRLLDLGAVQEVIFCMELLPPSPGLCLSFPTLSRMKSCRD